jgi:hypothetical protein
VGRTDYLISSCRSLLEVRNYLEEHTPCNGMPWGLINLVSHGNQWVGMSVKVTPDSRRTTAHRLLQSVNEGTFRPLPDDVVDEDSEIFLHGCGLGNNSQLLEAFAVAFGGSERRPLVTASRYFEYYSSIRDHRDLVNSQRYLAEAWFTHHKYGEPPSKDVLSIGFRDKYPGAPVDWIDALSRDHPRFAGDYYHYTFEVPLKAVLPAPTDWEAMSTEEKRLAYVTAQPKVAEMLAEIGIPAEALSWKIQKVFVDNGGGTRVAGILVKGYCTMVTVIQALANPNDGRPFQPLFTDAKYYSATCVRQN